MMLLDITITNGWLILVGIIAVILLYNLFNYSKETDKANEKLNEYELQKKIDNAELKATYQKIELQKKIDNAELNVVYQKWAIDELEKFKQNEIAKVQKAANEQYKEAALVSLQRWKIEEEAKIRQDAINRSYSVNLGKITEHLVPFHSSFLAQFNPKDARFIGSPIDLIVFDGYADKQNEITIYFVEVKTGNSRLTEIQKKIKTAVIKGEIRWAEINPDNMPEIEISTSKMKEKDNKQLPLKF